MILALPDPALFHLRSSFQDRLNACPQAAAEVTDWTHLAFCFVARCTKPTLTKEFRPLTLSAALQKLYQTALVALLRQYARPLITPQLGIQPGRQSLDIIFVRTQLIAWADEWRKPLIIAVAGVSPSLIPCSVMSSMKPSALLEVVHNRVALASMAGS